MKQGQVQIEKAKEEARNRKINPYRMTGRRITSHRVTHHSDSDSDSSSSDESSQFVKEPRKTKKQPYFLPKEAKPKKFKYSTFVPHSDQR